MAFTEFFWDPMEDNVIAETSVNGDPIAEYSSEPFLYGTILTQQRSDMRFYHLDGQGSTLALTDPAGAVMDSYAYNGGGELTEQWGGTNNPFTYIGSLGYYSDKQTTTYYVRMRVLSPLVSRWLSVDPLLILSNHHLYQYAANSPTAFVDPSGLLEWSHKVEEEPALDGAFGFLLKIQQTLSNTPNIIAQKGSQTWQTNDVNHFVLMVKDTGCELVKEQLRILDVNDIGGKKTPIVATDKIGVYKEPGSDASFCFLAEVVKKRLGVRPFKAAGAGVVFTQKELPAGNGYSATDEQWAIASKMGEPILQASMVYFFFNRKGCNCCTKDQLAEGDKVISAVFGSIDPSVEVVEYLRYDDLGAWFSFSGSSGS